MERIVVIAVIVVAVVAALWFLRKRGGSPPTPKDWSAPRPLETLLETIDATPDKPINFGYKNSWLAIRAADPQVVMQSLAIDNFRPANWHTGFVAAYNGHAFVSPPIDGWVFVVSQKLPELGHDPDAEEWKTLLESLSERFGDVQYFGTHRVVGYHAWARFKNGIEERAFSYLGESGETLVDRGPRTQGELELGYNYFDPDSPDAYWERDELCYPDEQHVMQVAGKWSVDPTTLESMDAPVGVGWIGNLPRASKTAE